MDKEQIILKTINEIIKFREEDNFKKELLTFEEKINKLNTYNIVGSDIIIQEFDSLIKLMITIAEKVEDNIIQADLVIDIFIGLQEKSQYNISFSKTTISICDNTINYGDFILETYRNIGQNRVLIKDAIDESDNLIYLVNNKKAPTYVKNNKKIYN